MLHKHESANKYLQKHYYVEQYRLLKYIYDVVVATIYLDISRLEIIGYINCSYILLF